MELISSSWTGMERPAHLVAIGVVFLGMASLCYCPFEMGTVRTYSTTTILTIIHILQDSINTIDPEAYYALGQTGTANVLLEGIRFTLRLWIYDYGGQFCSATPSPRRIRGAALRADLLHVLQTYQGDMVRFAASHFLVVSGEYALQYFNADEAAPPPSLLNTTVQSQLRIEDPWDPNSCWVFKSTVVGGPEAVQHSTLYAGQIIQSSYYYLTMQAYCNIVIYHGTQAFWSSGTAGKAAGCHLRLQVDGNLVIYSSSGEVVWATNIYCEPQPSCQMSTIFTIEDDGVVVVYDTDRQMGLWATNN